MRNIRKMKLGDTMIEVTIAIGIFSLVAITIVSVMNGGTSNSQIALETTLTREEVDAQAEALRFIHSAYVADMNDDENSSESSSDERYVELWNAMTNLAVEDFDSLSDDKKNVITGTPESCSDLYNNDFFKSRAFVINPRQLGDGSTSDTLIRASTSSLMQPASTFPRLVYNSDQLNNDSSLYEDYESSKNLYRAEGVYIIGVKDAGSTKMIGDQMNGSQIVANNESAFYDFYVRSCWYGNGNDTPSSVATVVRLYNPQTISAMEKSKIGIVRYYSNSGGKAQGSVKSQRVLAGGSVVISNNDHGYTFGGRHFLGWNTKPTMDGDTISWNGDQCLINYSESGTVSSAPISVEGTNCVYHPASNMDRNASVGLYAMWNVQITVTLKWGAVPPDLDSHAQGKLSNGSDFHVYYARQYACDNEAFSASCRFKPATMETTGDIRHGYGPEVMSINTVTGKSLYYYVFDYSDRDGSGEWQRDAVNDPTVTISSSLLEDDIVLNQRNASGTGLYWNVFAVINDEIVVCSHLTSGAPDLSYTEPCESDAAAVENDNFIVFDGNSATSGTMDDQSIIGDSGVVLNSNAYSRTNYAFAGWNTEPDGSGTSYSDMANVSGLTGRVTLYAQWDPISPTLQDFNVNDCKRNALERDYKVRDERTNIRYNVRYDSETSSCWMTDALRYNSWLYSSHVRDASMLSSQGYKYCGYSRRGSPVAAEGLSYCAYSYQCPNRGIDCRSDLLSDYPSSTVCPAGWSIPLRPPEGVGVLGSLLRNEGRVWFWLSSYSLTNNNHMGSIGYIFNQNLFHTNHSISNVRLGTASRDGIEAGIVCSRSD